jgi:RNA polymerase sigma factor (sigma-70 family)
MLKTSKLDQVEKHRSLLMSMALRRCDYTTAEDMVQETIIKALKHDRKHGTANIKNISTWLVHILQNTITSFYRLHRNQETTLSALPSLDKTYNDSYGFKIDIQEMLERLPKPYRLVIFKRIEGFNDTEIAKILGISAASVRVRAYRARNLLKGLGRDAHAK